MQNCQMLQENAYTDLNVIMVGIFDPIMFSSVQTRFLIQFDSKKEAMG